MDNVDLVTTFQRRFWCCSLAHSSGRSDRGGRSERDWSVETVFVVATDVGVPTHWSAESWQWNELLAEAQNSVDRYHHQRSTADSMERRAVAGMQKKKLIEVPRARQRLTGAALAPGTENIYRQLQNRRPQEMSQHLSQEVREFQPVTPVNVDRGVFLKRLKSAPRNASQGPGGCIYERLKILLDDHDEVALLFGVVHRLARAHIS